MKIFKIIALAAAAFCASMAAAQDDIRKLEQDMSSDNAHVADAARMKLEKHPDSKAAEEILVKMLGVQKDSKLKAGIAYSLGEMKSEKAFSELEKLANKKGDMQYAYILALGNYGTKQASAALKKMDKGEIVEISRLVAEGPRAKDGFTAVPKSADRFAKSDENVQVETISTLAPDEKAKAFLLEFSPDSPRVAMAQCFALAKFGGKDTAAKIFAICGGLDENLVVSALTSAQGEGVDDEILEQAAKENPVAVLAAGDRGLMAAEAAVLELCASENEALSRAAFASLQSIGAEKTFKQFVDEIAKGDENGLAQKVNVCVKILSRQNDADKERFKGVIPIAAKNAKDKNKSALEKIAAAG